MGTVERAFELARTGGCRSVDEIRRTLVAERYESVLSHLSAPSLVRQLRAAIATT
jgi:ribosomal protein L29